jgi:hypothetical protein
VPVPSGVPQAAEPNAPAWFYSALAWLGQTFTDGALQQRAFATWLAGSDVDPYAALGSTRLFVVAKEGAQAFRLTVAPDASSSAPLSGGTTYTADDAGIGQLYRELASSPIFAAVNYCYVPGAAAGLPPFAPVAFAPNLTAPSGYDPASGLRTIVNGTAIVQAVPLDEFLAGGNQQVYDPSPQIVPLATSLVFELSENNTPGATTFTLPVCYTRDQLAPGTDAVNQLSGKTVVFAGGPGFDPTQASTLVVQSSATTTAQGTTFTSTTFDAGTAVSETTLPDTLDIGVTALSCTAASPWSVFAQQRIVGFYRPSGWTACLGVPIFDYGPGNTGFGPATIAPKGRKKTGTLDDPLLVYDPGHPFLNGSSLAAAAARVAQASYLYSPERIASILDLAVANEPGESAPGLAVMSAALGFDTSSSPPAQIVDQLNVPVLATVTTTPPTPLGRVDEPLAGAVAHLAAANLAIEVPIGNGGQAQPQPPGPATAQVGLTAFVPREALAGTGIGSLEIGTPFAQQQLGTTAEIQAAAGVTVNLTADHDATGAPLGAFELMLASAGLSLAAGVSYVVSLTGTSLTSRGNDGSSASATLAEGAPAGGLTYVGAFVFAPDLASAYLYPKQSLTVTPPLVGTNGVQQGATYQVRLTYGADESQIDLVDDDQLVVARNVVVANPAAGSGAAPTVGDLYFGSFVGGAATVTVWSVPVFLTVTAAQLPQGAASGPTTVDALASGGTGYDLRITDSSLFVFTNIDADTSAVGSVSPANVFLAGAVINSAPDDATSRAFAPGRLLLGLVRSVPVGGTSRYVFIPEDDSLVIGDEHYLVGVVPLADLQTDPSSRPYPPVQWPTTRYWQFANRHNPYLDVGYSGETQADRIAQAQADTVRIGLQTATAQEPMQLYLDTGAPMTTWPIYPFPFTSTTQAVDAGQLAAITQTVLGVIGAAAGAAPPPAAPTGPLADELVTLPSDLQLTNPYTLDTATLPDTTPAPDASTATLAAAPQLGLGLQVTELSPGLTPNLASSLESLQSVRTLEAQKSAAAVSAAKNLAPTVSVLQERTGEFSANSGATLVGARRFQPVVGFTVFDAATGEGYIVELVEADLTPPDQLPDAAANADYDPYYVRVVFLDTLAVYNMTIIVPTVAYDQQRYLGRQGVEYANVLAPTDELELGYLSSLYDQANSFDELAFTPYVSSGLRPEVLASRSSGVLFSNVPYALPQAASYNPVDRFAGLAAAGTPPGAAAPADEAVKVERTAAAPSLQLRIDTGLIVYEPPPQPPAYFLCRRLNWNANCHLMQATHPDGKAIYLAFGGGDLVPLRLDGPFTVDKRQPAHMYKLTTTFADREYDAATTLSVGNTPYVVSVTTSAGYASYANLSLDPVAGTADLSFGQNQTLNFPSECYVVGQASTTLTSITAINETIKANLQTTEGFVSLDEDGNVTAQFQAVTYNGLVFLIRSVSNVAALAAVGDGRVRSGLLIDTFVPSSTGNLVPAQAARHQRSGLSFFGSSYTPTTMVDTTDSLDYTSITGESFFAPTIFVPIPELDASKPFFADLSNFLGQQFWTFVYPEVVVQPGGSANGVTYADGFNLDATGKPVLSLQKLHFVYDSIAVLFTPNDLAHKYALLPKQQILALTNGQVQEGICWRSANLEPHRLPPQNVCAQQILPEGEGIDRPNIVYAPDNRPVAVPGNDSYLGMSVNSVVSLAGAVYRIEESALANDQTGSGLVSAVSSTTQLVIGVLVDYDNDELGTLSPYDPAKSNKALVFLNGYLGATGYVFSSPDHFSVEDVLPSQVPLLEQIADLFGGSWNVSFYDVDVSLPRQFWSMAYDSFSAPGVPNFIPNVPPSVADPSFLNRTRSLVLNLQNPVRPDGLSITDTYSSVVSANLHLQNGVTGSVFLSKKADRDIASIGSNPAAGPNTAPLYGLPTKYDFFIFSRDHYQTLKGASFELIDQGYAMCLVDDGSGTGTKVARYYVDADGNYNELYAYVLYSPNGGVIETSAFTVKVTLGAPANPAATPPLPETPNNVNPQDLVAQINKVSNLIFAAFGPSSPGQPPAFIPIQAVAGGVQAAPIMGQPGFGGYQLNVLGASRQPVQISQLYAANVAYAIAGTTSTVPFNVKAGKPVPFYGSISHGLDKQVSVTALASADGTSAIPRPTVPAGPSAGVYGGNGQGALVGTAFSVAWQGSGAIPPALATNPTPGTTMKADDTIFYTYNAVNLSALDSTGKAVTAAGGQYFVDTTDPGNPIYGVVTLPKFTFNGNTYTVNLATTEPDGVTPRYTLIVGGQSYLFAPDNAHVTADDTTFTFNPLTGGVFTVTYASADAPASTEAPTPIPLTQFAITAGGLTATLDVFNDPGSLDDVVLGVSGRLYTYDPRRGTLTVAAGAESTTVPLRTGIVFASTSGYGYVIGFADDSYTVNGAVTYPYSASTTGTPASSALRTAPQLFTIAGNFYAFDVTSSGAYASVTGAGQVYPINPYQFSINGAVYIINTNVSPNTVIGGGSTYPMFSGNTQFVINGVEYTIALKSGSLSGATISGQFNVTQGDVVVIENYVYELDTLNGQIVGNGLAYPLTTSGATYSITTEDGSFTVATQPDAATVTIGGVDYLIDNTTVVADGVTYPILPYRRFTDDAETFVIGLDGTVTGPQQFTLVGSAPYTGATFTDGATTYTVNETAAFDGADYHLVSGTPAQFSAGGATYTIRTDGVAIAAGPTKTYVINPAPSTTQFTFGTETIFFGRPQDVAAFDGENYFALANGSFTDTVRGLTFTIRGNLAVNEGSSYEIFSNLGAGAYFEVPGGATYFVNVQVADTGTASGDLSSVFPISGGSFTIPLRYTLTIGGSGVTVAATTFPGGSAAAPDLTVAGSALSGGFFVDPVTGITYTCVVNGAQIEFVDSGNTIYPLVSDSFVASVAVSTAVTVVADNAAEPNVYPVVNGEFVVGAVTYTINVPVAFAAAAGPYLPLVNGRFVVPTTTGASAAVYTVKGATVTRGYALSADDQFSVDGNVVYTINAVNVVRASDQVTLAGAEPAQTLTDGGTTYALDATTSLATTQPAGLAFDSAAHTFAVGYPGGAVTYTVGTNTVTDNRHPATTFVATTAGSTLTFDDTVAGATFSFDPSGDNPISVAFPYVNRFFVDAITEVTYYIDVPDTKATAVSYLPETTSYAFVAADGRTYLIDYSDVTVVFPVVAGRGVNVGVATVGDDEFDVHVAEVAPTGGGSAIPVNRDSFELNGNLYSIVGTPNGADYSSCQVVGAGLVPKAISAQSTFTLTDPSVSYTLQLDADDLPETIVATFAVRPSRNLLNVNDSVYLLTYNSTTTGSLLGQGLASIPITGSGFTLSNPFDSTKAKFVFADLDIYDAASVVGQFTAYLSPTFVIGGMTYAFDPVHLVVSDADKRPYPLIANPAMFGINGANYVIDTNRVPHAIVGDDNVSPISTDVTVVDGRLVPNSTFTLGGQVYAYVEDAAHNLLAVTGTKLYPIAQPGLTFKLDSSLVFTLSTTPPAAGDYAGTTAPIGTITAGTLTLNLYAGIPESGNADFFTYKNVLYTLVKSAAVYVAVQKTYTVYVSEPVTGQQQLAVFDLAGTTYVVTDGTTAGEATAAGINPGTLWSATAIASTETQFGLVYGYGTAPINVAQSATGVFQFEANDATGTPTLYDIVYTAGGTGNVVKVDVPARLPTFTQSAPFTFVQSYPLAFETGGYNAFTTFVDETSLPAESFSAAWKTPVLSTDELVDQLVTPQGDFSVEFWHSLPASSPWPYHPFTYAASSADPLVYAIDLDFENASDVYVQINNTVMKASATPPVFSSQWRHVALTYEQPYVMLCEGAGFEVRDGSNYNLTGDFSIALTFSAADVDDEQGLVYKGTGSPNTPPELAMSYCVGIQGGAVTLQFTDGRGTVSSRFSGADVLEAGAFYQAVVVKRTTAPAATSANPYAPPPVDPSDVKTLASGGSAFDLKNFPSSGDGSVTLSNIAPAGAGANTVSAQFLSQVGDSSASQSYTVDISVRTVNDDGTYGSWQTVTSQPVEADDPGLLVGSTGSAHVLFGAAYDPQSGIAMPFGSRTNPGNIRDVYLFNSAIAPNGVNTSSGVVAIGDASTADLLRAGVLGYWSAAYDPNGVVNNPVDPNAVAISTSAGLASLAPLSGREFEGTTVYVNGTPMTLSLVTGAEIPATFAGYSPGESQLLFNAGPCKLQEISIWRAVRQEYQITDDMFGRLVGSNEPDLAVYLSGSFEVQVIDAPILPLAKYLYGQVGNDAAAGFDPAFNSAIRDLAGCPSIGRCGPLVTPNLYTPPGVALTQCDTGPALTTYSVTLNTVTGTLAGEINEVYVYIKDNVLTLYAGKKVGDLVLSWVSQEQGNVQLLGYVEGAPPAPMANLTNKPSYAGATSLTFTAPTSVSVKYQSSTDNSDDQQTDTSMGAGVQGTLKMVLAPFGIGEHLDMLRIDTEYTQANTAITSTDTNTQSTSTEKADESNKYVVRLEGAMAPFTGDQFMANLNTVTTPSNTAGTPSSKTAILPNPNLGGFTTSSPPAPLPKPPTEERFGSRMFVPSPYGQAFVSSQTLDVYQEKLVQSNTIYGFVAVPNQLIPRDLNVVPFRLSSTYLRPGVLDGMIGYGYAPATLPSGAQISTTSTGQLEALYDGNFSAGQVGHDASYMKVVEAYSLKRQIDQEALTAIARYQSAYNAEGDPTDSSLTPGLDFYNEYIWSSQGGTQELKHTYTTSFDQVYATTSATSRKNSTPFNIKFTVFAVVLLDLKTNSIETVKTTNKYSYNTTGQTSFDITAAFDGIEADTQMRYASANDAHFVLNNNSLFNTNNQSGLNLVVGSDGLVYNLVPSASSGAGLPLSDNLDTSMDYTQPQPAYTTGNADGLAGALEPYDRPGKTSQFRTLVFFLQPTEENDDDFWSTVIDQTWLVNSPEPAAEAMRSAVGNGSVPWRVLYRVTYSERFLPPISAGSTQVPQITPVMAVPVLNPVTDFLFQPVDADLPRPALNPANDVEANVVLVPPTASGQPLGTVQTVGPNVGLPLPANNVIPFDLLKSTVPIVNWGDTANVKLLGQLLTSVLGLNTVAMSSVVVPGSTKLADVIDPVGGGPLYSTYLDPNGIAYSVATEVGITVYQDVNGNPIQYYDGKTYNSLQADYVASPDGSVMYYLQPPSGYDQSAFTLVGDYDLFGRPGDEWRFYLVSGFSADLAAEPAFAETGPFLGSPGYAGFTVASAHHSGDGDVQGYVLVKGVLQWPHLNSSAETFADVSVYKSMSVLDTFPIGDPGVLTSFLQAQYPKAPFVANADIKTVFARNIVSYFNAAQQTLLPQ